MAGVCIATRTPTLIVTSGICYAGQSLLPLGFLGSPKIRVDGKDVEPGADKRGDFALACRVHRTSAGTAGVRERAWIQAALNRHPAPPCLRGGRPLV